VTTTATLVYSVLQTGPVSNAVLAAQMAAVPLPLAFLQTIGVRVVSDSTVLGPPIARTIVLGLGPSMTATATAVLEPSTPQNSPVIRVTTTAPGADYVAPPVISFAGPSAQRAYARALLKVVAAAVTSGGAFYATGTFPGFFGGLPPYTAVLPGKARGLPLFQQQFREVVSATISAPGMNYSPQTTFLLTGGLCPKPLGRQAVLAPVLSGGKLVGIKVKSRGDLYISPPQVTVIDPQGTGSGATVTITPANMTQGRTLNYAGRPPAGTLTLGGGVVTGIVITDAGEGLVEPPAIAAVDPTGAGSGAEFSVSTGVGDIQVQNGGKGFSAAPTVVVTPLFRAFWPDTSDQKVPFYNLILSALRSALGTGVVAAPPVIA
jgi:hypothetical protein